MTQLTDQVMPALIIVMVLIVAVKVAMTWQSRRGDRQTLSFPYTRQQALFSTGERLFLKVLEEAIGDDYRIFGKVRVADVADVNEPRSSRIWQSAFNRINAKHFDFVVCEKTTLAIVCVIELDDRSHLQTERKQRDAFLMDLCKAISLPLVKIPARREYSVLEVKAKVLAALGNSLGTHP